MEGDARSNGSERRLAWISRTPRGAIADWEERSLSPPAPGTDMPGTPGTLTAYALLLWYALGLSFVFSGYITVSTNMVSKKGYTPGHWTLPTVHDAISNTQFEHYSYDSTKSYGVRPKVSPSANAAAHAQP